MSKQSWMSGGKGLALTGGAVAAAAAVIAVIVAFGLRGSPPQATEGQATAIAPAAQTPAPSTEVAPQSDAASSEALVEVDRVAGADGVASVAEDEDTATDDTQAKVAAEAPDTAQPVDKVVVADPTQTAPSGDIPLVAGDADAVAETATTDTADPVVAALAPETAQTPQTADTGTATIPVVTPDAGPAIPQDDSPLRTGVPSFDTVRLAPDGEALVAGRADAGSTVEILLDGAVVGTAMTGGDRAFAAFLSLPPSDAPRVLTLAVTRNGALTASDQQVIIAPVQKSDTDIATSLATSDAPATPEASQLPVGVAAAQTNSAPALLLSDATGVRVLQPATPADPAARGLGIALDVISYTDDGDILLQGRGAADAKVLIYLDNAAVTSVTVDQDGIWSSGLPGVSPGVYTLRLDEVDTAGKVLSRIETPFKREDRDEVAAIAAAGATSPVSSSETSAQADAGTAAGAQAIRAVTVQPGNTLWAIARENYGEGILFVRLFEANRDRIRNPDLIYPGQIFEIPE